MLDQKCLIYVLLCWNSKKLLPYLKPLEFVLFQMFSFLKKYLGPKMAYMHLFGLKFESNIVIFEITTPEFFWLQNFVKK